MKKQVAPSTPVTKGESGDKTKPAVQVLKPGKRRIVGTTKFGQDGCGY